MELPLLTRAQHSDNIVQLVTARDAAAGTASFCGADGERGPVRLPGPGEQYRFHFDMTRCIGCKCCVVACNEQNGNPAEILWRRVGEIEGGTYPDTRRHYLSIGCNHCLEPTCMIGCPVNAYSKDGLTGIVRHSAEACIGCQYCTWNCSYGVPQFNPDRGVVGKCDMCYGRLEQGQSPACVVACPEDAIQIEIVRVDQWRKEYKELANSPGMPSADDSLSTTRITLPKSNSQGLHRVDLGHLHPESPHWPLVIMTVLTQLSVGAFTAIWRMQASGAGASGTAALIALLIAVCALSTSTLHLGRPIHAARALRMWRRSWLSREVLLFTLFAAAATLYSICIWARLGHAVFAGAATTVLGVAGVGASARLYLAPGRPAWNSPFTIFEFFATTLLLGASVANLLEVSTKDTRLIAVSGVFAVMNLAGKFAWLTCSSRQELCKSWQLLSTALFNKLLLRVSLLTAGLWLGISGQTFWVRTLALTVLVTQELLGRYLFFVSVVPTNIASGFLSREAA